MYILFDIKLSIKIDVKAENPFNLTFNYSHAMLLFLFIVLHVFPD